MSPRTPTVWICKSRRNRLALDLVAEQSPVPTLEEFEKPRGLPRRASDGSVRGAVPRHHAFRGSRRFVERQARLGIAQIQLVRLAAATHTSPIPGGLQQFGREAEHLCRDRAPFFLVCREQFLRRAVDDGC